MSGPPSDSLHKQYEHLVYHLMAAHEMMKASDDDGRSGLRFACQAMVNFLIGTGAPPEAGSPFFRLKNGFDELRDGKKPRFFSRNPDPIKRPRGMDKRWAKRFAIACVDLLMSEECLSLVEACAKVARHAQNWPGLEGQRISSTTIENWRQTATEDEAQRIEFLRERIRNPDYPSQSLAQILKNGPPAGVPASDS